jgi:hypothetical protein
VIAAPTHEQDKLQSVLWCINQIVSILRVRKPRHVLGVLVSEMNAIVELHLLLGLPLSKSVAPDCASLGDGLWSGMA